MASWQAHATSFLLRHTFKKRLIKASGDLEALRSTMNWGKYRVPADVVITPDSLGGVPGEWVEPRGRTPEANLLFLHGGGYFACSPRTHRSVTCWFALKGMRVFVPDYRLAPENPFPAAVDDACAAMGAFAEELGSTDNLVMAGDSAGGGLALATLVSERDAGHPLPSGAILFSPWTDLAITGASVKANERRCAMFTADGLAEGAAGYLDGADPGNPLASPLYANLGGLPPLLIHASEDECLRDDSVRLATRAREQGTSATLKLWPVVPHVWQLFYPLLPEGRASLREAANFAIDSC